MPKRRKKKGSDAWKNIVRLHKRGPKRVKLARPRRKGDDDPLLVPKHSKRIQIILNDGIYSDRKIGVVVFNQAFTEMGLGRKKEYTMTKNKLTRAGHALRKCLDLFSSNDYILGHLREKKLNNFVGRCIVMTGKINKPDVLLNIVPDNKPSESQEQAKKLFDAEPRPLVNDVEYM
tara:strand:- start:162 stop:686 length:525 start_codon:yes stop_codon:yes gene_type:complete